MKKLLSLYFISELLKNKRIGFNKFSEFINSLKGGGKILKVKYHDYEYKFIEGYDENYYILYSIDDIYDCVAIIISDNTAEIHSIGNYKECLFNVNKNIGSTLLKITIKMLKKSKEKLNINKILLTDNSIKRCGKNDIKLSQMLILLTGNTWYGKYNFRPSNTKNDNIDSFLSERYNDNIKIIDNATIKTVDIIKYIKMTKNDNLIRAIDKVIKQNPEMKLSDFLSNFLSNFDKMCKYFYIFYEQLYYDLKLYSFYKSTFILLL